MLGGYMSPVHDAYNKKGLAPAHHRMAMCQLAADTSPLIMVDSWEAAQEQYKFSLHVLQHLERAVNDACCLDDAPVRDHTGSTGMLAVWDMLADVRAVTSPTALPAEMRTRSCLPAVHRAQQREVRCPLNC